ncbi:MAG: hypothetical protein IT330_13160 [Anaerolineae bacterium]|nr:hypothetical protein [Anaerolineae bacterium]
MKRYMLPLITLAALLLISLPSLAQTGGGYGLTWSTIDGGGSTSTGGGYELSGTIGQPDAGLLSGGGYTLAGGFWGGGVAIATPSPTPTATARYYRYLPLIYRAASQR